MIFISWSGEASRQVALALQEWLPSVMRSVQTCVSPDDNGKSRQWFNEFEAEIERIDFVIMCLTPDNHEAPWLLFEAGVLSNSLSRSRVSPLLIGVSNDDLTGPFLQFEPTLATKEGMWSLLKRVNELLGDSALVEPMLRQEVDAWWPKLERVIKVGSRSIKQETGRKVAAEHLDVETILNELLMLSRSTAQQLSALSTEKNAEVITKDEAHHACSEDVLRKLLNGDALLSAVTEAFEREMPPKAVPVVLETHRAKAASRSARAAANKRPTQVASNLATRRSVADRLIREATEELESRPSAIATIHQLEK